MDSTAVEAVLLPFLLVQALAAVQILLMAGTTWAADVPGPAWTLWFLQTLLYWRLALPWLAALRHPLTVSVVAALVAGYLPFLGLDWSGSRTVAFPPFFLLGWRLRQGAFDNVLRAPWSRPAALGVLAATGVSAWLIRRQVDLEALKMRGPYGTGGPFEDPWAWTGRAVVLLAGGVVLLSFVRLVPARRLPFVTYLGAGGFFMYLLHPFFIRPVQAARAVDWVDTVPEQVGLLLAGAALAAALASPPVRALARPLVRPRLPVPGRVPSTR